MKTSPNFTKGSFSSGAALSSRIPCGVPGLDESIGGGLPKNQAYLLLGPVGVGKTFFGVQFLLEGLAHGEKALLLQVSENPDQQPGLDLIPLADQLEPYASQGRLKIFRLMPGATAAQWKEIFAASQSIQGSRALLELELAADRLSLEQRKEISCQVEVLKSNGVTLLITNRYCPPKPEELGPALDLSPSAAGCVLLRYQNTRKDLSRSLVVLSLKGSLPRRQFWDLDLGPAGFSLSSSAKRQARPTGASRFLLAAPNFENQEEKQRYGRSLSQAMKRLHLDSGSQQLRSELVFSDIYTTVYSPSSDFGLLMLYEPCIPFLARQNLFLPLENLLPGYENRFHTLGLRRGAEGGHQYSLPLFVSTRLLYYRKDLLDKHGFKPPRTWQELEETCQAILKAEKKPALQGLLFEGNPLNRFNLLLEQLWSQGDDFYQGPKAWVFQRKAVKQALERLRGFVHQSKISPPQVWQAGYWEPLRQFVEGQALFCVHWSDGLRLIQDKGAAAWRNFGTCRLPTQNPGQVARVRIGGPSYVIPRNTRHPEAARALLKNILEPEFLAKLWSHPFWPFPAQAAVLNHASVRKANPYFHDAEDLLRNGALLEEAEYLGGNPLNWQNTVNYELKGFLEGDAERSVNQVLQNLEKNLAAYLPRKPFSGLVAQAVQVVERHTAEAFSVQQLAQELAVTRSHLIREFRRQSGTTPLKYLNQKRMEKAREMLENSHYNVSEVANKLGFEDLGYFGKVFKKFIKRNPSEFKRAGF